MSAKAAAALAARFTIQRLGEPSSPRRFLAITDEGMKGWSNGLTGVAVFKDRAAADDFHRYRMGEHADDAVVVRHTVQ